MLVDTVRYKGEAAGGRPLAGIVAMFGAGASIADAASTEGGGKRPHASRPTGACPFIGVLRQTTQPKRRQRR